MESVRSALTRFTGPTDLTGHPSLSVPCGLTGSGLPVGMQLIGRPFDEATLYRFGHGYEEAMVQDHYAAVRRPGPGYHPRPRSRAGALRTVGDVRRVYLGVERRLWHHDIRVR